MATPFENFIQTELPKRPYLDSDVSQETVIVRRGAGPRQLAAVTLTEGQVLGFKAGVLQGVTGSDFTATDFASAQTTWTITHGRNNRNAIATLRDSNGNVIQPDELVYNLNTIVATFANPQTGTAVVVYLG